MTNTSPSAALDRDFALDRPARRSPLRSALCALGAAVGWALAACGFAALAASFFISVTEARLSASAGPYQHQRLEPYEAAGLSGDFRLAFADVSQPVVALVIDDVGLDQAVAERVLALPASVTVSVLAYAPQRAAVHAEAARRGHETFVHLPMEPMGFADPGPGALATWMPAEAIAAIAAAAFDGAPDAAGFNNHMGSRFTRCAECLAPVMSEARRRGLAVLDSLTDTQSVFADVAREAGLEPLIRDVFLDDGRPGVDVMRARLAQAEAIAARRGWAVVIAHPHDATLDVLETWIPEAQGRGVHVGTTADARARRDTPPRLRA